MSTYIRLTDYKDSDSKEQRFFKSENRYEAKQDDFEKIPGSPIAYWVSDRVKEIFENVELQTKEKATNYLKISLNTFLNNENIKNFKEINQEISKKVEESNIITIQSIILKEIEASKEEFKTKMKALKEIDVDTSIKLDNTTSAYCAILSKINEHFGSDFNINDLDYEKVLELYKNELIDLCKQLGLETSGRKSTLVDRVCLKLKIFVIYYYCTSFF